jgi:hypothetical protein
MSQVNQLWGAHRNPRGTAEVGDRDSAINGGQISMPAADATFPLGEPFWPIMRSRWPRSTFSRSNGDVSGFVCLRRAVAYSTSRSALPCDRAPDPGVDDAAASGSVFRGTKHRDICCAIEMRSMAQSSPPSRKTCRRSKPVASTFGFWGGNAASPRFTRPQCCCIQTAFFRDTDSLPLGGFADWVRPRLPILQV